MNNEFTVEQIQELITSLSKNKMSKLKIQSGEYRLEIEGEKETVVQGPVAVVTTAAPSATAPTQESPAAISGGNIVVSPIVGTFYESPSPESAPFVRVGSQVKRGDVLFIIESMKLMNEVTSQFDGVVEQIHVKNGQAVEYNQPVLTIK